MRTLGLRPPKPFTLLKVLLAIILLIALVRIVDVEQILSAALKANGWLLLLGAALLPVNLLLENLLWHRLVAGVNPHVSFRRSFGSLLLGHALGLFTPARTGEYVGRPLYLGLPDKWQVGLMVATHRFMDLAVVVVTGTLGLLFFRSRVDLPYESMWLVLASVGAGLGVFLLIVLLLPQRTHHVLGKVLRSQRLQQHIAFLQLLDTRTAVGLLSLAWARYLVYTTQFLIFLNAFVPGSPLLICYAGVMLVMFAKFVIPPVTFADLGIRESASVFFFSLIGIDGASAFNAAIVIYCINLLLPSCLGLPLVFRLRLLKRRDSESTLTAQDTVSSQKDSAPHRSQPFDSRIGKTSHPAGLRTVNLSRDQK